MKQILIIDKSSKYFTEDATILQYKANQARQKTDYHVWAYRPVLDELLRSILRLCVPSRTSSSLL